MKGNLLANITVAFFLLSLSFSICLCNVHVLITSGLSLRDLCLKRLGWGLDCAATDKTANAFIPDTVFGEKLITRVKNGRSGDGSGSAREGSEREADSARFLPTRECLECKSAYSSERAAARHRPSATRSMAFSLPLLSALSPSPSGLTRDSQ